MERRCRIKGLSRRNRRAVRGVERKLQVEDTETLGTAGSRHPELTARGHDRSNNDILSVFFLLNVSKFLNSSLKLSSNFKAQPTFDQKFPLEASQHNKHSETIIPFINPLIGGDSLLQDIIYIKTIIVASRDGTKSIHPPV